MKRKLMLLFTCLFMSIGFVTAQTSTVSGIVTSEEDGEPVVGASVLVAGTSFNRKCTKFRQNFAITLS